MFLLSENSFLLEELAKQDQQLDQCLLAGHLLDSQEYLSVGDLRPEGTVAGFVSERNEAGHVKTLKVVIFAEEKEGEEDAITILDCEQPYIVVERNGREVMEYSHSRE